jgi:hypothetical protein
VGLQCQTQNFYMLASQKLKGTINIKNIIKTGYNRNITKHYHYTDQLIFVLGFFFMEDLKNYMRQKIHDRCENVNNNMFWQEYFG